MDPLPGCVCDNVSSLCYFGLYLPVDSREAGRGILINSYVIQNLSWQLGFWFMSIACGLSFVGVFFLVPEVSRHIPESRQVR